MNKVRSPTLLVLITQLTMLLNTSCDMQNNVKKESHTNSLIKESSPYLLQHAHNPVDWLPWGDTAFEQAREDNKLVIVSIGYSSCHWCHVMERESFEDSAVAALMNEHFVSVKVDREERPDVDQIYMTAVQLMTGRGGWPLNVVTLPDGRPVWGGTYFPKEQWMQVLEQIQKLYQENPDKVEEYAAKLTAGIRQSELVRPNSEDSDFTIEDAERIFANWKPDFDKVEGGSDHSPKFPLPNNYAFLLRYAHLASDEEALEQVQLTLKKMAYGGIYDQVGGGFARYSTDMLWKVPHFEKMLYDNAQLVSLYSEAYQKFEDPLYRSVVEQTLEWIDREMTGDNGEFYSALDADSEGEEGKFYVWTEEELKETIPAGEWEAFAEYYDLRKGRWEGKIILVRSGSDAPEAQVQAWWQKLLKKRSERTRPGLDDKALTSWNALMITGLVDAYKALAETGGNEYLTRAVRTADWFTKNQLRSDGGLHHSYKDGKSSIEGLIEDYAFAIQAFLKLFEATFERKYLDQAAQWMDYAKANFEDSTTSLFYTRSLNSKQLIAKSLETVDNVIPAANSAMAQNLFLLGHYLDNPEYEKQSVKMLNQINKENLLRHGGQYSNWAQLLLRLVYPHYEMAIAGDQARHKYLQLQDYYLPNVLWIASETESELPLLENRCMEGSTKIYVCQNRVCQLPVEDVEKAMGLIN